MAKKKLSPRQIEDLRREYEAWNPHDPSSMTADELAAKYGISKQTLYTLRREWLEEDRTERETVVPASDEAQRVIKYLTEELVAAKVRIAELERMCAEKSSSVGN